MPLILGLAGFFACAGIAVLIVVLNLNKKTPDEPNNPDRQARRPDDSNRPKPKEETNTDQRVTPPKNVDEIKKASVFVKVEAGRLAGSGSGFVIKVEGQTAYVATNCHVVVPNPESFSLKNPPRVTVVLDSGTAQARSAPAEILGLDPERDLAVLRINGVSNLPSPIDPAGREQLRETLPVLICGFPFGERLAASGNPEITIASSSITSLRLDSAGELEVVQVGAGVHPGNSGGPVVDRDGRLVGITVAALRGGGLGFAIPPRELTRMLQGRTLDPGVMAVKGSAGIEFVAVVPLVDPLGKIRNVALHHVAGNVVGPNTKPGASGEWAPLPGARRIDLEIVDGKAAIARMDLKPMRGRTDTLQVSYTTGDGKTTVTEPFLFALAGAPESKIDPTKTPPPVVPPTGVSMTMVNRFPERFEGQTIVIRGNMSVGPVSRGDDYELQMLDEGNAKPQKLHFAINRDDAIELATEMQPGASYVVQLTGKIEKRVILGRTVFQVSKIELFDGTGRVVISLPLPVGTPPEKPNLKELNRFAERYAGKKLTIDAKLFRSIDKRGDKYSLQVQDEKGHKPRNVHFAIAPEFVQKMPKVWSGGKEDTANVRLTGDILAEQTDDRRQIMQVKRIEFLDKDGRATLVVE
jgi:S1-C subfamily serine protease